MSLKQEKQMPNTGKSAKGKRMTKTGPAKRRAEEPLLGEAALKAALAGFGIKPDAANGSAAAASPQAPPSPADAAPAPKTVSQVLGEITWLFTQSPRHKSIPVGDLEWLVMPAILLKQFRIF